MPLHSQVHSGLSVPLQRTRCLQYLRHQSRQGLSSLQATKWVYSLFTSNAALVEAAPNAKASETGCKFGKHGCTSLSSGASHEASCRFRPVYCPDIDCQKSIPVFQMVKTHLPVKHPDIRFHSGNKLLFRLSVRDEHWTLSTSYKAVRFNEFGLNFFREARRDHLLNCWFFWVYFDGTPAEAQNIQAEISFLSESKEVIETHVDNIVPLDFGLQQVMQGYHAVILTDDIMRHKIVKKEEFYLSIALKKKKYGSQGNPRTSFPV